MPQDILASRQQPQPVAQQVRLPTAQSADILARQREEKQRIEQAKQVEVKAQQVKQQKAIAKEEAKIAEMNEQQKKEFEATHTKLDTNEWIPNKDFSALSNED